MPRTEGEGSNTTFEGFKMSCPRVRLYFALVVSIVAGLACGDYGSSTSPPPSPRKLLPPPMLVRAPFSLVPKGHLAEAVRWGPAHESVELSVSAVVGPEGGTLSIPAADFSMTIPPGALIEPTTIRVVARAGTYVVYDMYPHGLQFRQPVTAAQGLSTIRIYETRSGNSVRAAYLPDGKHLISGDGFASATELQAATTYFYGAEPVAETQEWILNHFSRYILVSGVWLEVEDDYVGDGGGVTGIESIGGGTFQADSLQSSGGIFPIDSVQSR